MSAAQFLITGLPRTKSAWLSNFFTHGSATCPHELSRQLVYEDGRSRVCVSHVLHELELIDSAWAGTADSGLLLDPGGLVKAARDGIPVALILREIKAVRISLHRKFQWTLAPQIIDNLVEVAKCSLVRRFQFEELHEAEKMRELQAFLMPNRAFDEERFFQLRDMNIQVHAPAYKEMIRCLGSRAPSR